jgi:flagellar protein FliS
MFGYHRNGAQAYARVGLETGVNAANPHKLITMLFEGALIAILKARQHMEAGEITQKGEAISKAAAIIDSGLRASLNFETGGEIAQNMDALYAYMSRRLTEAHAKNDPAMLMEVHQLLTELKTAWDEINPQQAQAGLATGVANLNSMVV